MRFAVRSTGSVLAVAVSILAMLSVASAGESVVAAALGSAVAGPVVAGASASTADPAVVQRPVAVAAVKPTDAAADQAMASARPAKATRIASAPPRRVAARDDTGTCSNGWCRRYFVLMLGVAY